MADRGLLGTGSPPLDAFNSLQLVGGVGFGSGGVGFGSKNPIERALGRTTAGQARPVSRDCPALLSDARTRVVSWRIRLRNLDAVAEMVSKPMYRIDGAAFSDLDGFYAEIEAELLAGAPSGRSIGALHDLLRGEAAALPPEFILVWEHSDLSRRRLGSAGDGSFMELIEAIARHPNVELILS